MSHAKKVRPVGPPAAIKKLVEQLNAHIIYEILPYLPTIDKYGTTSEGKPIRYGLDSLEEKAAGDIKNIKIASQNSTEPEKLFLTVSTNMLSLAVLTLFAIKEQPGRFSKELVAVAKQLDESNEVISTYGVWSPKVQNYLYEGEKELPQNYNYHPEFKEGLSEKYSKECLSIIRSIVKQNNSGEDRAKAASELQTALDNAIEKIEPFINPEAQEDIAKNDHKFASTLVKQLNLVKDIVSTSDRLIAQTEANLKAQKEGRG